MNNPSCAIPTPDSAGRRQEPERKDSQVKISGNRVEPAELETALRKTPGVTDAAVLVRRDGETVKLVAFVAGGGGDLRGEARKIIRAVLPRPMHPARLHLLGAIPHLPSGKVDAPALERLDSAEEASFDETSLDAKEIPAAVEADARPVVVLFPGLSGYSFGLASLRADFGAAFRFVTVTYPGWREIVERAATLDDFVAAAATQILAAAPEGELRLVGYSLGGAVAYGAAARLAEAGRITSVLVILDTNLLGDFGARPHLRSVSGMRDFVVRGVRAGFVHRACRSAARFLTRPERKEWLRALARIGVGRLPAAVRFELQQELGQMLQLKVLEEWVRRGPPATRPRMRAVLFRSERKVPVPHLGWAPYLDGIEFVDVGGDHSSMLSRPHRVHLAKRLAEVLSAVRHGS
jgi:thioesterase domain-containing protein